MNTEIFGVVAMFIISVLLAIPLGRYMGKVYNGEKTWLDPLFNPIDKLFFKLGGIKPEKRNELAAASCCLAVYQSYLVPALDVYINEYELVTAQPGREPIHECRSCIQYNHQFYIKHQPAALFRGKPVSPISGS